MDKILKTHEISTEIINLIEHSKNYCFLVTPYFKPWPLFNRAIEKASKQQKNIVFVFRYDQPDLSLMKKLNADYDFDVIFIEKLHSKLYMNERSVILSSMNLYESSKELNFETGYKIDGMTKAKKIYKEVIKEDLLSIKPALYLQGRYGKTLKKEKEEAKKKEQEQKENRKNTAQKNQERQEIKVTSTAIIHDDPRNSHFTTNQGYCIRCRTHIPKSDYRTMCDSCFSTWASWGDGEYPERYCHSCGKESNVNKDKPLCYKCYKIERVAFNNI